MKKIDVRLDDKSRNMLSGLVGKRFESFSCDEFHFRPAVYQAVYFTVDGKNFAIENKTKALEYFGSIEDMGVITISEWGKKPFSSRVVHGTQIEIPVNEPIAGIQTIDDVYTMTENGEKVSSIAFTKAVVFLFSDRQIVFEKDVWFSEDIYIHRGSNAVLKVMGIEEDKPEDCHGVEFLATRSVNAL